MGIIVNQFYSGGDRNFGYLVYDDISLESVIIDPSYSPAMIFKYTKENNMSIKYIFNTHLHFDHTNGNNEIEKLTGLNVLNWNSDRNVVYDGAHFIFSNYKVKIIHTPGHSEDSICILIGEALFSGDTLFIGKVGGTKNQEEAFAEYNSIHTKLMILPDNITIYPGHDYGTKQIGRLGEEKITNPFLIQPDFESFFYLKNNWAKYKLEHGIK